MYQPRRLSRSVFVPIRGLDYHLRTWGEGADGTPPLVLLHGWMDVAASWQFLVDALTPAFAQPRLILAPDWRGFGQTALPGAETIWFPDYLADLDALLDHYAPGQPVDLVGHSMGGNVAMMYAGVRPQRVRRLVNLEGFGLPATEPSQAPGRYAQWLDQLRSLREGGMAIRPFASREEVAARLMKTNPRLAPERARWLAGHWAQEDADGRWRVLGVPAHKVTSAQLYRVDEALALHRQIAAPTLWVQAEGDILGGKWDPAYTQAEVDRRLQAVATLEKATIADAGHMLHHDQPEVVAREIENFLAKPA